MTIHYYDTHGESYFEQTKQIDVIDLHRPFMQHIPKDGYILDAGCGSGRDSRYFLEQGYRVLAMDASATMARLASDYLGQTVVHQRFSDIQHQNIFDGIWACASLLHVPRAELPDVFQRLATALKNSGVFYASFKWGTTDRTVDGRLFTDFDAKTFQTFIASIPTLTTSKIWKTIDQTRPDTLWLNVLLRRIT